MAAFTRENLKELLAPRQGPCVSVFLPATPGAPDSTRRRRCLAVVADALSGLDLRRGQPEKYLDSARRLLEEGVNPNQARALALFLSPEFARLHRLPISTAERVHVGEYFLIVPLLPLVTGDGPFHVLALSKNGIRLLRCTRDASVPVELTGVPANLDEAMATHDTDEPLNFHTRPDGSGWAALFHGHGVGIDDAKDDLLRYFQQVDRGLRRHLGGGRTPLVLAAVDYLHPIFRRACDYAGLLPEGLKGCPDRLSDQELHDRAWPLVEPIYRREREGRLALYRQLHGTGRTGCAIETLIPAACRGEIETLFVACDRQIRGRFDSVSAQVERREIPATRDEDLLEVASAHVLRHGGTVHPLATAEMPSGEPLAGIYWLPNAKHGKRP